MEMLPERVPNKSNRFADAVEVEVWMCRGFGCICDRGLVLSK